jgi:hypothetical protein
MPTAVFAAITSQEVVQFCKNYVTVFGIIMLVFNQRFPICWKSGRLRFISQILIMRQTGRAQTSILGSLQKTNRFSTQRNTSALALLNGIYLAFKRCMTTQTRFLLSDLHVFREFE